MCKQVMSLKLNAKVLNCFLVLFTEKRKTFDVNMPRDLIERELHKINIDLKRVDVLNSTNVKVKWEVSN